MDPKERFTNTVADYDHARPDYPQALFDWLMAFVPLNSGDAVLDVGCGTGISSRQLAARGLRVVAVDPNRAMLDAARARASDGILYIESSGEGLDVPNDDYKAIVGGQSFHWLDLSAARTRFRQLCSGWIIPFWNLRRVGIPFMDEYESLLKAWSPEYVSVGAEHRVEKIRDQVTPDIVEFEHHQDLDRDAWFARVWSSSYVRSSVNDREAFDAELDRLFRAHETNGRVRFAYRTVALPFRA